MKLFSQRILMGIVFLCVFGCEPMSKEIAFPKNSVTVPKDTVVVKVDSVKIIFLQDSIKKTGEAVQIFEFYDITPPDVSINFPSHSIVSMPVNIVGKDIGVANSFCEYWLYTKDGKLVCYCKNTVSGLHPVYANSFNDNNHLPQFTKKIAYGDYRLVYKNISKVPVRQNLIFGTIISEARDQIDVKVDSGEIREYWIKIYPSTSNFKMNNNNREKLF
jgi:hypothetical protein